MNNTGNQENMVSPSSPQTGIRIFLFDHKQEIVRKLIHFLIAFAPSMAAWNYTVTLLLLAGGVVVYSGMEVLRLLGVNVPLVSFITRLATRDRKLNRFVLAPVTLGLGALLALLLYPPPAASLAIYTLAFGDGLAGLAGKLFGKLRPAFLFRKSVEGSLICFTVVFIAACAVLQNPLILETHPLEISHLKIFHALIIAAIATLTEALPFGDYDNLILPLVTGLATQLVTTFFIV